MKRILIALLVVGLVMAGVGFAMGGNNSIYFDNGRVQVQKRETKTLSVTEQLSFKQLDVRCSATDVKVIAGDKFGIEAVYEDGQQPEYELDGDVLKVYDSNSKDDRHTFSLFNLSIKGNTMTIILPRQMLLEKAYVKGDVGDVELNGIRASGLIVGSDTGRVQLNNVEGETLEISTDVGDLLVNNTKAERTLQIKSGTGSINGHVLQAQSIELIIDVGDTKLSGIESRELTARGGTGRVELSGELRGDISVQTGVGDIVLRTSLPRDQYIVDAHASVGDVRIDQRNGRNESTEYEDDQASDGKNPLSAENRMTLRSGTGSISLLYDQNLDN